MSLCVVSTDEGLSGNGKILSWPTKARLGYQLLGLTAVQKAGLREKEIPAARTGLFFNFFLFLHVRIAELTLGMFCSFLVCCFLFFSSVTSTTSSTLSAKWLYVYPRMKSYQVISPFSNFRQQKFPSTHTKYISVGYEHYFYNSHWHD